MEVTEMADSGTGVTLRTKLFATCALIVLGIVILVASTGLLTERIKVSGPVYQAFLLQLPPRFGGSGFVTS
jgi:hypothetical protein